MLQLEDFREGCGVVVSSVSVGQQCSTPVLGMQSSRRHPIWRGGGDNLRPPGLPIIQQQIHAASRSVAAALAAYCTKCKLSLSRV